MRSPKLWTVAALAVAAAVISLTSLNGATPYAPIRANTCAGQAPGSYLATFTTPGGDFVSRGILTFQADGNFVLVDSNQGGVSGAFNPFTNATGAWQCTGRNTVAARALDFVLPGPGPNPPGIVRVDFFSTLQFSQQSMEGEADLASFALDGDPLHGQGTPFFNVVFSAERIFVPGS